MKKFKIIGVALLTVIFLAVVAINAFGQDKTKAQNTPITVQKTEKPGHEKDLVACKEKHAKGDCTGHKPGECTKQCSGECKGECKHHSAMDCKTKHTKSECTGHEPGKCEKEKK